jgi:hypothetical protein
MKAGEQRHDSASETLSWQTEKRSPDGAMRGAKGCRDRRGYLYRRTAERASRRHLGAIKALVAVLPVAQGHTNPTETNRGCST